VDALPRPLTGNGGGNLAAALGIDVAAAADRSATGESMPMRSTRECYRPRENAPMGSKADAT